MSNKRIGDWFQTYSGVQFYPYDPRPEDVLLQDIAHHLSLTCRFNGAVREFYSVGQHSVHVAEELEARDMPRDTVLCGLLHDAAEAYIGDMVRPLKLGMPQYREVEARLESIIAVRFALPNPMPDIVKAIDNQMLYTERRDLLKVQRPWSQNIQPRDEPVQPWSPAQAEEMFITFAARYDVR